MKNTLKTIGSMLVFCSTWAGATPLVQEPFGLDGALVGTAPGTGGAWQSLSGTAGTLLVSGGRLQIQDDNTEDAESDFSLAQLGDVYVGFTLNMSAADLPSVGGDYFASFREGTGNDGRIFSYRPAGTAVGKFRLGLSNGEATATVGWAEDLETGVDYRVVAKFTQNGANDFMTLWIGPTSEGSPSISTTGTALSASLSAFAFRQTSVTGDMSIDNLIVATTFAEAIPEPSTVLLSCLGCLLAAWAVRRRAKSDVNR